jgi:hypothetical protein
VKPPRCLEQATSKQAEGAWGAVYSLPTFILYIFFDRVLIKSLNLVFLFYIVNYIKGFASQMERFRYRSQIIS